MNPVFDRPAAAPPRRSIWGMPRRLVRGIASLLLLDLARRRQHLKIEDAPVWRRIVQGICYRLLFLPVVTCAMLALLVYMGTHPPQTGPNVDPLSVGIYYDPVSFAAADGTQLEGWLVPALEAKNVLKDGEQAVRHERPALILVHDFGASRAQMLPLVAPLREAGYILLVITLRGAAPATRDRHSGCARPPTLRPRTKCSRGTRQSIRIASASWAWGPAPTPQRWRPRNWGISARWCWTIPRNVEDLVNSHLAPPQRWLEWLRPVSKWIFEVAYSVDAEDVELTRCAKLFASRPVLMFDPATTHENIFHNRGMAQVRDFLARHLEPDKIPATAGNAVEQALPAGVDVFRRR